MHWTEYAAIGIVVLVAVPVAILFVYLGAIAWACVRACWSPEMPPQLGRQFATEVATFVRNSVNWSAAVHHRGRSISLSIDDQEGVPKLASIRDLPMVLSHLVDMEQAARRAVEELTPDMQMTAVSLYHDAAESLTDTTLTFSRDGNEEEAMFVDFRNGKFEGWEWVQ